MEGGVESKASVDFFPSVEIIVKGCLKADKSLGLLVRFVVERCGWIFRVIRQ